MLFGAVGLSVVVVVVVVAADTVAAAAAVATAVVAETAAAVAAVHAAGNCLKAASRRDGVRLRGTRSPHLLELSDDIDRCRFAGF
jgi:hypothetical protein